MRNELVKNRGQIWVETVIYTLIGLALIGIVLAIATPKINETKDKIVVEQSIQSLSALDDKILETLDWGQNNVRVAEFTMRRGELLIDPQIDQIIFTLSDLKKPYSEPGVSIAYGRILILTEQNQKTSSVKLMLNYSGIANITYQNEEVPKLFNSATIPYKFFIRNKPNLNSSETDFVQLDIEEFASRPGDA